MGKVYARKDTGKIFIDFSYKGQRCREQTALPDTKPNRKKVEKLLERIEAEITLGVFDYAKTFPNSPRAGKFKKLDMGQGDTPLFEGFANTWFEEMLIQWRKSHQSKIRMTLNNYLIPQFGEEEVGRITKASILEFRASLAKVTTRTQTPLSASRVNQIMNTLRMILDEAANRYNFSSPYQGIKSLKIPRTSVEPFRLEEVQLILENVRADFRNYYTVRFFTGMRTGEIDGLQWDAVDFDRRQIAVKRALVNGEIEQTKNHSSYRIIDMNEMAYQALKAQQTVTGDSDFVFCTRIGTPLSHNNVTKRVWYPLLRYLGLPKRTPYQTRHTAATLWLASGENPEWIARQMGHTTTEMLFRVYSRYVPNLTRQDGSAFERLLAQNF
ncbi:Arm DNA-binding domain-containing protein [Idiomarina sp. ST10R2A5]|uniref:Arm DNA-binding domain-containing protein n=1 Tax=Idiomarina sp. ST10R2A5 TaxID=3418368 RepID=UPI003EC5B326